MGSATIFFWLEISNVNKKYRTALAITGLVTAIATYHYFRIFNSWNDAFNVKFVGHEYQVFLTGQPFNDAYRYVDWVLTVPLLLIELILVMGLPAEETVSKSWKLGVASAAMVALGYPGEIQDSAQGRWMWWFFASVCSLAHHHLLVDLSLRVHHQDAGDLWCGGNSWRADRIFLFRCLGQSCLRSADLGYCQREVQAGRRGTAGLS